MKKCFHALLSLILLFQTADAQKGISFDLAGIRNAHSGLNGLNISLFNHFSDRFRAGLELNTFFPSHRLQKEEDITQTGLDFDLNFHYLFPLHESLSAYPIAGISHTLEKETGPEHQLLARESFWSFNTGAGLQVTHGRWIPHVEYLLTWGHINQQYLLVGVGYELSHKRHTAHPAVLHH